MAARVLANHFEKVTLLERDTEIDERHPRKGVPQGRQFHALLTSGLGILAGYFPGFIEELSADGVDSLAFPEELRWFQYGSWKSRAPCNLVIYPEARVRLEGRLRARVRKLRGVKIQTGSKVEALEFDCEQVTGVRLRQDGRAESISADLIVDASGRGSQIVKWLRAAGYPAPPCEIVEVDMVSVTRIYWKTAGIRDWKAMGVHPLPTLARGGHLFPLDAERWIVTLFGYLGEHPPADPEGFLLFARTLSTPDLYEAIASAVPAGEIVRSRYSRQTRHRFDRVERFPAGLLLIGDAMCSFDPVFGQGMSVACQEARALDQLLGLQKPKAILWKDYFRCCRSILNLPWMLTLCEGLRFPRMKGRRTLKIRFLQWYTGHLFSLSATNPRVYGAFLKVLHLEAAEPVLFHPAIAMRVLLRALRGWSAAPPPLTCEPMRRPSKTHP
ncbi:MAG: monooxygenase FAD-binding [Chthoniobacteraceae bacterium]|nr:monooxygenase FAD-binding [Chthoniobacteraceae bacterium]